MNSADSDYFRARAEQEREAARQSSESYIAEIHLELAKAYAALAEYPELRTAQLVATGKR